jgi:hypothetical protein
MYSAIYIYAISMVERVLGAIFENATAPTHAYVTRWGPDPCESCRRLLSLSLARSLARSLSLTRALLMLLYVYLGVR